MGCKRTHLLFKRVVGPEVHGVVAVLCAISSGWDEKMLAIFASIARGLTTLINPGVNKVIHSFQQNEPQPGFTKYGKFRIIITNKNR